MSGFLLKEFCLIASRERPRSAFILMTLAVALFFRERRQQRAAAANCPNVLFATLPSVAISHENVWR
jgi:hypothetical protein